MATLVQPGDILADKYLVDRVLGEGGMALVVAARHLQLHQIVAIKIMRGRAMAFPGALDRFIREAQTVVRLRSENVARVMDVGTLADGMPFMVMEYLEGVDLSMVLAHRGALAVEDAVDCVLQTCAAMAEAHAAGIIHRDLKPGNLFLTQRPNGAPLVKVLDFGISKARPEGVAGQEITETQDFGTMGSPPYMSPEQARSAKHVDERSDIWSLGVILYHLTSGRLPFFADSAAEVLAQILYEEPEALNQAAPWVSRKFAKVVMRCLEKDPEQRYQTVTELIGALARFASDEGRLLVDASLLPSRRIRSMSSESSSSKPGVEEDEDTQVDVASTSIVIKQPERLELSRLFAELPARTLDDAYPRTTFALYTGELAEKGRSRTRRRAILAVAGLLVMGAAAGGVAFLTGGIEDAVRAPAAAPSRGGAGTSVPAATTRSKGTPPEAKGSTPAATSKPAAGTGERATTGDAPALTASDTKASADPDKAAEPDKSERDAKDGASSRVDEDSSERKSSKRRKGRKSTRKKTTRTPKDAGSDPFGTIR